MRMLLPWIFARSLLNRLGYLRQHARVPPPFVDTFRPYSDATAQKMDEEARGIVDAAYRRTIELVSEKKEQVMNVPIDRMQLEPTCTLMRSTERCFHSPVFYGQGSCMHKERCDCFFGRKNAPRRSTHCI